MNRDDVEPGAFCGLGLATSDPVAAANFYTSLFGWESHDEQAGLLGTYTSLRHHGEDVAMLYRQTAEARTANAPPHWTPFLAVDDVDAIASRVAQLGGMLLREPHDLADGVRAAAVRDPVGGIVSLWQREAPGGREASRVGGAFFSHELVTTDVGGAKTFYRELLGWCYEAGPTGWIVTNAGNRIGAIREPGPQEQGVAGWIPAFAVDDVADARQRAERKGGRTLVAPAQSRRESRALLADPHGATFALMPR